MINAAKIVTKLKIQQENKLFFLFNLTTYLLRLFQLKRTKTILFNLFKYKKPFFNTIIPLRRNSKFKEC